MMLRTSVPFVALLFLAACGGSTPPADAPKPGPTEATKPGDVPKPGDPATGEPKADAWSDGFTKEQKVAFMKTHVSPRMAKVFQAGDAKRHAEFGCKTCHGAGKAPQEHLPKLTMKDGKLTCFAEKPDVSKFMAEKVVPEMAAAMGQKPYDPATHQGFGCGGCHAIAK